MSQHQCPAFETKVVWLSDKGAVVQSGEEYFNLWKGAMGPEGDKVTCAENFGRLSIGSCVKVTCKDPVNHAHHMGPDGELRPHVSAWRAEKLAGVRVDPQTQVEAAERWRQMGRGILKVKDVKPTWAIVAGPGFTGLWHISEGANVDQLQVDADTPELKLKANEVRDGKAYIRLTRA
jgi:hypothetical protein